MGRALLRLAGEDPHLQVVAAVSPCGSLPPEAGACHGLAAAQIEQSEAFDLAIDFSLPSGFDALLGFCQRRGSGLISGTTGLSPTQFAALEAAAARIPLLWAANFSLGVAVMTELARQAAAALPSWDADIVESHHRHKKDAPSGTALHLGAAVAAGRGSAPHYASLRAGDIVGEHVVQLAGEGERLELVHRATSRDIFARGALEAARRLQGKPAGRYHLGALLLGAASS